MNAPAPTRRYLVRQLTMPDGERRRLLTVTVDSATGVVRSIAPFAGETHSTVYLESARCGYADWTANPRQLIFFAGTEDFS